MAVTKSWAGAGLAAGNLTAASVGTGDTAWSAVGSVPTIVLNGSAREINVANTTTAHQWRWANIDYAAWQTSWTFRLTTASAAAISTIMYVNNMAAVLLFKINISTADQFTLLSTTNAVLSTSGTFAKDVDYDFEMWGTSTGNMHVRVYNRATKALFWTTDKDIGATGNVKDMIWGRQSGGAYGPGRFGNFKVGNEAIQLDLHTIPPANFAKVLESNLTTQTPVTIAGVLASNLTTILPISAAFTEVVGGVPPDVTTRIPYNWPFTVDSPFNAPISTAATFETTSDAKTASFISQAGNVSGKLGQLNYSTFSIPITLAAITDPLVDVTNTANNTHLSIRIPTTFASAAGSDGAAFIVQPDGHTAHDFYRMAKVSNTAWTTTRIVAQDLLTDGIGGGVRASGFCLRGGLILASEVNAQLIQHALVMSIPKEYLKLTPTAADGEVIAGKAVWPAVTQDNQANVPYSGVIPMGTLFAIPASVNLPALGLSGSGLAVAYALQRYGIYIGDQSTTFALYGSPSIPSAKATEIKTDWRASLIGLLRRVKTNTSTSVGGGPAPRLAADAPPFA